MIRIAICDDSAAFLKQTKFMIDHWNVSAPCNIISEVFEDGDSLLSAHAKSPFDIILLDVVMPMLNGIETARELRQEDKNVKIVFLTSSSEFAVESYSVKASNYLLKPVDPEKLFACLDELVAEIKSASKSLIVKGVDATHRISLSTIEYVEAQSKHNMFYTIDNKMIETIDPLYSYEKILTLEEGFLKCHRSYIVNIHRIDSYTHSEIVMHSGCRIPIARSHQKTFEDLYFGVIFKKAGEDL